MTKKKYIGKDDPLALRKNKAYEILSVERDWYRIVDETGEDYLYPPEFFVDENEIGDIDLFTSDYVLELLASGADAENGR